MTTPPGAEIGVPDLGIPHLPVGQADIMLAAPRNANAATAAISRCHTGIFAVAIALSAAAPRSPQPSRMHNTTGRGRGKGVITLDLEEISTYLYTRNRANPASVPSRPDADCKAGPRAVCVSRAQVLAELSVVDLSMQLACYSGP